MQIDPAVPKILTVVAEESRSLLDRVRCPSARRSRHVRHCEASYGVTATELFAADENMRVPVLPRHLVTVDGVDDRDGGLIDRYGESRQKLIKIGHIADAAGKVSM